MCGFLGFPVGFPTGARLMSTLLLVIFLFFHAIVITIAKLINVESVNVPLML